MAHAKTPGMQGDEVGYRPPESIHEDTSDPERMHYSYPEARKSSFYPQ